MMTYANPDCLVDTDWLADHLDDPDVRIVEVDEDTEAYRRGHIPGAVGWDWNADLHHAVRRDYVGQEELLELLRAAGVDDGTTVVLYGGNNNWFAAYGYWLLKMRGFDSVRLLDGGRTKWEREDRPLTTEAPDLPEGDLSELSHERPELRALREQVLDRVGEDRTAFVDVRSPEEFSGEKLAPEHLPQEQPYVGGHIPGAHNISWSKAAREDGSFRPVEELRELYAEVLATPEAVAYCRIGERAAHTWFVLHELVGHERARNYDGSWTEYGSMVGVPVERGP
ncbi:MAG TPA: sulfurtransferase [Longimicrobiales bacterium]|nr:sulfurtransferase [Longimicrobiales bacterium]